MSCPTCGGTLQNIGHIGHGMHHCPRCGTLTGIFADGSAVVPTLVDRCRSFEPYLGGAYDDRYRKWVVFGIAESINTPGNRLGQE